MENGIEIVVIEDLEEYLHMEDSSCSELEDIEEFRKHVTDSEQDCEDFELSTDNAIIDQTYHTKPYLKKTYQRVHCNVAIIWERIVQLN
ncbi:unnamed protein product [Parnassius apollo]|uniref:(apollo) hypothetical protein n=1 Tax=Parnassius apollo TaxID=110799 RepID=A0A8S3WPA1_PARAO|nr:unnamed protein product [Parnassius apollo]